MTRFLLGVALATAIGCTGIQRVGPLAGKSGGSSLSKSAGKDLDKDFDEPPGPVTVAAPKPPAPTTFVTSDEVTPDNPQVTVAKLRSELEADGKNTAPPWTAAISRLKNGVPQD